MTSTVENKTKAVAAEAGSLDLTRLLGFRDLAGVGSGEGEMAAALDAAHVKIGTPETVLVQGATAPIDEAR